MFKLIIILIGVDHVKTWQILLIEAFTNCFVIPKQWSQRNRQLVLTYAILMWVTLIAGISYLMHDILTPDWPQIHLLTWSLLLGPLVTQWVVNRILKSHHIGDRVDIQTTTEYHYWQQRIRRRLYVDLGLDLSLGLLVILSIQFSDKATSAGLFGSIIGFTIGVTVGLITRHHRLSGHLYDHRPSTT